MITCVLLLKAADPHQRWITLDGGQHVLIEGAEGGGARIVGGAGGSLNNRVLTHVRPEHIPPVRPPERSRRPPPGQRDTRPVKPPVDVKPPPVVPPGDLPREHMTREQLTAQYVEHMRQSRDPENAPAERQSQKKKAIQVVSYLQTRFPGWTPPTSEETPPADTRPPAVPPRPLSELSLDELRAFREQLIRDKHRPESNAVDRKTYDQIIHQVERWIDKRDPQDTPPATPPKNVTPPSWETPAGTAARIWESPDQLMTSKEKGWHDKAFSHPNLPHAVLAAIQKAPPLDGVESTKNARSSFYVSVGNGRITMKPGGRDPERVNAVWRHEFGHHVDYSIGTSLVGRGVRKGEEVSVLDAPVLKKDADTLVQATTWDRTVAPEDYPSAAIVAQMEQEIDQEIAGGATEEAALQTQLAKAGLDPEELRPVFGGSWDKRRDVLRVLAGVTLRNPDLCQNTKPLDLGTKYNVQDFISAITNNRLAYECKHTNAYYKNGRPTAVPGLTDSNCTEAFANWFDAQGSPVRFWRTLLMKLAPDTHAAFQKRVDTWLMT